MGIEHIQVNRAPKMRRRTYRAHGRINPYMSSPCHIEICLVEKEQAFARSSAEEPEKKKVSMNISLSMTSNSTHKPPERNDLLMSDNILQIFGGTVQRHRLDSLSCLSGILEVNPQV